MSSTNGGAPLGNNNGAKGKEWLGALRYALNNHETSSIQRGLALRAIASGVVEEAIARKEWAVREISERLDGKVGSGDTGGLKVLVVRDLQRLPNLEPVQIVGESGDNVENAELITHDNQGE
jgi:hypothetical protein